MEENQMDWVPTYEPAARSPFRKQHKRSPSIIAYLAIFIGGVLIMLIGGMALLEPSMALGLLLLVFALLVYFLPAIIALSCDHVNITAIVVLNLLTGWTFLGWVAALVWACMDSQRGR